HSLPRLFGNNPWTASHLVLWQWPIVLVNRVWSVAYYLWSRDVLEIRAMKNPIQGLHKEFENRIKLGIMSVLMVNDSMDFLDLKEILEVTDGNLASHINALEKK